MNRITGYTEPDPPELEKIIEDGRTRIDAWIRENPGKPWDVIEGEIGRITTALLEPHNADDVMMDFLRAEPGLLETRIFSASEPEGELLRDVIELAIYMHVSGAIEQETRDLWDIEDPDADGAP